MLIERFYDEALAHASYMVISGDRAVIIDPARDPQPYYDFANQHDAEIVGVIETHPHADFVSSHAEIGRHRPAVIYVSKMVGAEYPHEPFDEGDVLPLNGVRLKAIHTPGHSPDSISVIVEDETGKDHAIFTGDSLFIGDVGRPDLREKAGNIRARREEMAHEMYRTVQEKFRKLDDDVLVLPAHGAGSLCGKNLSDKLQSTIGEQKRENAMLKPMSEAEFVETILEGQPFIPQYFKYDVEINKRGAPDLEPSLDQVPRLNPGSHLPPNSLVIDTRPEREFKLGHLKGALNIQEAEKFETWLGTLVKPETPFFLIGKDAGSLNQLIYRCAKIGYEQAIQGAMVYTQDLDERRSDEFDPGHFKRHRDTYTIVDVRNESELVEGKIFPHALHIPLDELPRRIGEVPTDRPVVVHCAGGYRSAAAHSILEKAIGDRTKVYDLSEEVKAYEKG